MATDAARRWIVATVVVVLALLASTTSVAAVRWYRDGLPEHSRPGDACPVTAPGGLVGIDAHTGSVRWTNIVPPWGELTSADGSIHYRTTSHREPTDRTIDPDSGAVTACHAITDIDPATGPARPDELTPGAQVGELTVVRWGSGLRATDRSGKGIWGTTDMYPKALVGPSGLLVQTERFGNAGLRTAELVDLRTGRVRWEQRGLIVNADAPQHLVILRGMGDRRRFRAIDLRSGKEVWRTTLPAPDPGHDPHAWEAGRLMVFSMGADGRATAVDAQTGRVRWTVVPGAPGASRRTPDSSDIEDVASAADGATVVVTVSAYSPEFD